MENLSLLLSLEIESIGFRENRKTHSQDCNPMNEFFL